MAEWFQNLHPVLQALIRVLIFVLPVLMLVPLVIWFERRLLGWFQDRIGPNRVGPFGLLQPIADGAKLMFKEDITPGEVDRMIYFIAPILALLPAFLLGATIPFGPWEWLTPIADIDVGILYIFAAASLGVYGLVLAGYAANNKYSLMGGLRASAQQISYELGLGISLACVVLASGSLKPTAIVAAQQEPLWGLPGVPVANWFIFTPYGLVAGVVFFICMIAEMNRAPFDLPEAENELVAGYHTEYSSFKFAAFFMGEYAAMVVWSAIFSTVFLGGFYLPFVAPEGTLLHALSGASILGPVWLFMKIGMCITGIIWLRATLPRFRYDQLMSLGWKVLLPVITLNLILIAAWILAARLWHPVMGLVTWLGAAILLYAIYRGVSGSRKTPGGGKFEERTIVMVDQPPGREADSTGSAPAAS
jgi:NADH-quinone oxidoreductase subunit H